MQGNIKICTEHVSCIVCFSDCPGFLCLAMILAYPRCWFQERSVLYSDKMQDAGVA